MIFWCNYLAASFFNALAIHISWEAKERDTTVIGAFTLVSRLVYGDDHFNLSNFRCLPRKPDHLTHTSRPKSSFVEALRISNRISSQRVTFSACSVDRRNSAVVMVFSSHKCTSCVSDGVIVTGFETSLKYPLHLPSMYLPFQSRT